MYRFVRNFVIAARLDNWLLLLHLYSYYQVLLTAYNAMQIRLTSLCAGDAQSSIAVTHYIQTATNFTDPERIESLADLVCTDYVPGVRVKKGTSQLLPIS